jgi:16S rRNA (cytosine967-C5)-methyltransferase
MSNAAEFTIGSGHLLGKDLDGVWRLDAPGESITRSKLWADGEIVVQDLASITAGAVTSPAKNDVVLDVCSAPGNKTSHLASIMEDQGEIYSVDNSAQRLSRWTKEIERTGCSIASPICADARRLPSNFVVDTILVDPPCSNTGVLAKNPSIKWKITQARVNEYAAGQYAILQEASRHLRAEGSMVYCTCSLLPEENEEVIDTFLSRNSDFKLVRQTPFLASPGIRGFDRCQRFYPHVHQCNGYFIAKLKRTS